MNAVFNKSQYPTLEYLLTIDIFTHVYHPNSRYIPCSRIGVVTRFPRFNDPAHLLVNSRRGRCGEWAQGFLLAARAAGLAARFVVATTDHVWTEVWSRQRLRWLHADSCEDSLDAPLLYERGWGRNLEHVYAVSAAGVVDVIAKHTRQLPAVMQRRLTGTADRDNNVN